MWKWPDLSQTLPGEPLCGCHSKFDAECVAKGLRIGKAGLGRNSFDSLRVAQQGILCPSDSCPAQPTAKASPGACPYMPGQAATAHACLCGNHVKGGTVFGVGPNLFEDIRNAMFRRRCRGGTFNQLRLFTAALRRDNKLTRDAVGFGRAREAGKQMQTAIKACRDPRGSQNLTGIDKDC